MADEPLHQVVPGVLISPTGEVTTDPSLHNELCELALALENDSDLPVDLEHVLAALVLAVNDGEIASDREVRSEDWQLRETLAPHVRAIFEQYGGEICGDDS